MVHDHDVRDGHRLNLARRPAPVGGRAQSEAVRRRQRAGTGSSRRTAEHRSKARSFARLGEILRERGRFGAARIEYAKAVKRVGAGIPVLADKFALAAMQSGHEAEAEAALREALRGHPQYAALHLHLARVLVQRKQWSEAKEALLRANQTDPFDPEIHAGLATVLEAQGDRGTASRERRFAQILSGHGERAD